MKRTSRQDTAWAGLGFLFFFGLVVAVEAAFTYPLWGALAALACLAAMAGCGYKGRVYYWQKENRPESGNSRGRQR